MTRVDYERIPAANFSTLKEILPPKTPAHYRQKLLGQDVDTTPKKLGRCKHMAVFEPERFKASIAVWDGKVRNGKVWKAFAKANAGLEILTKSEVEECLVLQRAVRSNPKAAALLQNGLAEQIIQWTDAATGLACKARLDYVAPHGIVDLKNCRDASPSGFARHAWTYRLPFQAAFYKDGYKAATKSELPFFVIAAENDEPNVVQVYEVGPDVLEVGRQQARDALNLLSFHRTQDIWPGYSTEVLQLQLPAWAAGASEEDDDVTGLDLVVG